MPAPRINDELGDELPPPLLCNAHLLEHTDKHRSSVADLRGIYPALFFNPPDTWTECAFAHEPRHVHLDARWTNRGISLENGERACVSYCWKKKKRKRKSKIIPRSIFSKIDERKIVKGDTKMTSCPGFFFLFLADRFIIQLERVN